MHIFQTILNIIGMIIGITCGLVPFVLIGLWLYNDISERKRQRAFPGKLAALLDSLHAQEPPAQLSPPESETPQYPLIIIGNRSEVYGEKKPGKTECSPSMISPDGFYDQALFYAADGWVWRAQALGPPYRLTIWKRLRGIIITDRPVPVELSWRLERPFNLHELQEVLCLCVDEDDDVLTQFIEHDRLKKLIRETEHFQHLFNRLRKMRAI